MPSIRKTKTASGATAVQVVRYEKRKVVIVKHVGSGRSATEIAALIESASAWIGRKTEHSSLFAGEERRTLSLAHIRYLGVSHSFARELLINVMRTCGFDALNDPLLIDLALMRIVEPCSKLRSIELLKRYFGVVYAERTVYRSLAKIAKKKPDVERIAVAFAQERLSLDLSLVLYDVTTLYFETFDADDLRVPGFSKDNKSQQPQVVVGLLVSREGFPLGYQVFKGNTFEGHTMLPVLEAFVKAHGVAIPCVVADAAMISRENVQKLLQGGFSYVVGARLANCQPALIKRISASLSQTDGATVRVATEHGDLVCVFSAKRYRKDKAELDKQIAKAEILIKKGEPGKRARFVRKADEAYELDEALRTKATALLGIKGYYTNIPEKTLKNDEIIARYRDLWRVEAAFRMSKSDLAARPIFHRTEDAVRAHLLICFVALAAGRHIEIAAGLSLRAFMDILWSVTDARIEDTVTGETITLRSEIDEGTRAILKKMRLSY